MECCIKVARNVDVQCTCILLYTQEWCINGGPRRRVARKKSPGAPETQNFPFWPHFIWGGSLLRPNLPTYTLTHPPTFRNCKKIEHKLIRSFECNLLGGYSTVLKRKNHISAMKSSFLPGSYIVHLPSMMPWSTNCRLFHNWKKIKQNLIAFHKTGVPICPCAQPKQTGCNFSCFENRQILFAHFSTGALLSQ